MGWGASGISVTCDHRENKSVTCDRVIVCDL